ncbi:hypothetical protein ACHAW6_012019 [Cyclotella cf. meneghiniana]
MEISATRRLALLSCISFYIGYLTNHHHHHCNSGRILDVQISTTSNVKSIHRNTRPIEQHDDGNNQETNDLITLVQQCYHFDYFSEACVQDGEEVQRRVRRILSHSSMGEKPRNNNDIKVTDSLLTGAAAVSKEDLMKTFDAFGVATMIDHYAQNEDALLLYQTLDSLPTVHRQSTKTKTRLFAVHTTNTSQALENCDTINVQFLRNRPPSGTAFPATCTVWIPTLNNLPSFHVQRWMRHVDVDHRVLRHVGSLTAPNGVNKFDVPKYHPIVSKHWEALRRFLEHVDEVLEDVRAIIDERWRLLSLGDGNGERTVIVMTVNRGDADLLLNFLCAAKSRNLDVRRILVFVTDEESQRSIEALSNDSKDGLGVMVYFDRWNLADVSQGGDGQKYGDGTFVSMMFAKILCVLYVSLLGYDVLYQDADIVWYSNLIPCWNSMQQQIGKDVLLPPRCQKE